MAELIRKDKLIDWTYRVPQYYDSMNDRTDMRDFINGLPTTTEAEIRAKALKYAQSRFRHIYETMVANQMENCINWADMLDSMVAEQLKEE